MKLKPFALGVSLGAVWGGVLFLTTRLSFFMHGSNAENAHQRVDEESK